jgi:exodeoxyribonuclease-3
VKGLSVASIYLPVGNPVPSPNYDYKRAWFRRLLAYAKPLATAGRPVVLAGDLNVVPTDADIYNASLWRDDAVMQEEVRELYAQLLAQGWIDTARALHPNERIFTFWHNRAFLETGMQLDFCSRAPSSPATGCDRRRRRFTGASQR